MTEHRDTATEAGRVVRLTPVPRGFWLVLLGGAVAVLAPLFGFLVGTELGVDDEIIGTSPMFLFLFLGFLLAGAGLAAAAFGVRRIVSDRAQAPS
jgi:hypothetical protein